MTARSSAPIEVCLVALPETAGSALYGMLDVLSAAGTLWQTLTGAAAGTPAFRVRILGPSRAPFTCGNGIPVSPALGLAERPAADIVIVPEIWLGPDDVVAGRYPELMAWLRERFRAGSSLYSACSGSILLAESGLLDGCAATSHWGYQELFRRHYPQVNFQPAPNLAFADPAGRVVTAGGTTSWHDLALHIIARHAGPAEALRIAKVYLLKWHAEGQLPYAALVRRSPHADARVRACEDWLAEHFAAHDALQQAVAHAGIPERSLKRRFKAATGVTPIERLQDIRIERAKGLLEEGELAVEAISLAVGYEDASFFRRLFRRRTGLSPSQYRRMFQPLLQEGGVSRPR
ncbi:helix-turn-helix domain-containing protein [Pseudomonas stutzeri]|nr:helix-turn-helix domain-containing protein [Stutzerimonas stutzeri]